MVTFFISVMILIAIYVFFRMIKKDQRRKLAKFWY